MQAGTTFSFFGYTVTAAELLVGGAILLVIAGIMLIRSRRHRIVLQRSLVTDELMIHLSRIADLLERQAMRPIQTVIAEPPRRAEDPPPQKLAEQAHSIPYSMFGR
jgi:hypothetical protein